jgi:uncharacterized protein YndB with AHSA1/START domain
MKNTGTLKVTLPSDNEILLTRVFDAPRHLVFEALTRPELIKRWFGPHGWSLSVCEVDFRVGGAWRYVMHGPNGRRMGMFGDYREIVPVERIVHTERFDEYPGEAVVTTILTEEDGRTIFNATVFHASKDVRDAVIKSGMEHGAAETYDRLNEMLLSQVAR